MQDYIGSDGRIKSHSGRQLTATQNMATFLPFPREQMAMIAAAFNHRAPPHQESLPFMLQMQDLMSKSMRDFKEGSIVKGRILEIRPREVLVDIGYKSEGVIPDGGVRRH